MVAPSSVEAVQFAGGWLFDRVMAGWDATVVTPDCADTRPLRILGSASADLEAALGTPIDGPVQAVAIDARLYGSDDRVRRLVREALDEGSTEVMLWGEAGPGQPAYPGGSVCHRLSVAALAFKAQALAAARAPAGAVGGSENFRARA